MATINAGRVRPYPRGAWSNSVKYNFFDLVTNGGSSYLCINTSGAPAGTALSNGTYWALLAEKGDTGPQGATGPTGAAGTAATITIGTVTTGAAGTSAVVTNVGTATAAKLNFTIPRGNTGATGASGVLGTQVFIATTTVTVPSGATKAIISGRGGGGGRYAPTGMGVLGKGGPGGIAVNYPVSVTAGSSIKVTIGSKGADKTTTGYGNAGSGGVTSFGSLLSLGGGGGAVYQSGTISTGTTGTGVAFTGLSGDDVGNIFGTYGTSGVAGILIVTWAK